jgi:hypothetical protein
VAVGPKLCVSIAFEFGNCDSRREDAHYCMCVLLRHCQRGGGGDGGTGYRAFKSLGCSC